MPSTKDYNQALAFACFSEDQGGVYPPSLAAHFLRMTSQGVWNASERGRLDFVTWKKTRYYGARSLRDYRQNHSRQFQTR